MSGVGSRNSRPTFPPNEGSMPSILRRFLLDDGGQDLIEYALLTALIGFAGLAAFDVIQGAIAATYGSWESSNNDLWVPNDPK
jgi:Flp pilus assembly pilin Flp